MPGSEIIDLTNSPPESIVISDDDDHLIVTSLPVQTNGKKRSGRRKKGPVVEDGEIAESSARTSRPHSIERASPSKPTRLQNGGKRLVTNEEVSTVAEGKGNVRESKRRRGDHRPREQSPRQRRRSYSPEPRRHDVSPPPSSHSSALFFVDVQPSEVKQSEKPLVQSADATVINGEAPKLLLPAHVSALSGAEESIPAEILLPSDSEGQDDDYIEYLDYMDRNATGVIRYFDAVELEPKQTKIVCKNCGAEGKHKTYECPVKICLMCGARDEHSTRGCPISKLCHSCGMKGHLRQTCPNRYSRDVGDVADGCDRCGSDIHKTNECPTWWRLYEYVSDEEREQTLQRRREKSTLRIGYGGEGFIAEDQWCYNCGDCGHLGDDCNAPHLADRPQEPSAFGIYNTMSGPFFDPSTERAPPPFANRRLREWEQDKLPDGWGQSAPINVGKQGRKKDRAKMERLAQEADDAEDDWFGNERNARNRDPPRATDHRRGGKGAGGKKISFGFSANHLQTSSAPAWDRNQPRSAPTLLDRISSPANPRPQHNPPPKPKDAYSYRNHGAPKSSHSRRHDSGDSRWRDGERERDRRERDGPRPRYKGGYGR